MSSAAQTSTITLLAQAANQAQNYDWKRAADLYKQVLESLDFRRDSTEAARITELLAKSHFKATFQAKSRDGFVEKMHLAEAA